MVDYHALDVAGKKKNLEKLAFEELCDYCNYAKEEFNCSSAAQTSNFLSSRYGWNTKSRLDDITKAWEQVMSQVEEKEKEKDGDEDDSKAREGEGEDDSNSKGAATEKGSETAGSKKTVNNILPVILKSSALDKTLLCEVDDQDLQFSGDSGAIGRFFCDSDAIRLDLKGRQYSGTLTSGPTVLIINISNNQTAKVETITNEFCHLHFQQDQLQNLQGLYSGAGKSIGEGDDEFALNSSRKIPIGDGGEVKNNPKISTITNKKRTSTSKSGKKTSAARKKTKK